MERDAPYSTPALSGWMASDAYSTAWLAMVPDLGEPSRPAWPQAVDFLLHHQLPDGGWGAPHIYYAHERTISTAAAIAALSAWPDPSGQAQCAIQRGLRALRRYARDLAGEPHEPVGFELLLPRLRSMLLPQYEAELPLREWEPVEHISRQKLALIERLEVDPRQPRAWWFSLEMLPEAHLALLDDSILGDDGSVGTSTAATAAYLRARRGAGLDSPRAARYLENVLRLGNGSAPFCWPAEVYERVWMADSYRRGGFSPADPQVRQLVEAIRASWVLGEPGLSSSDYFPVNDGDDTLVGFTVLTWAGVAPPEDAALAFWNNTHFLSYLDERSSSVSANIHGLTALRTQPGFPHRDKAERLAAWLLEHRHEDGSFDDKWHYSPFYSLSRAIPAFAGWKDGVARECAALIVERQREDGGWGWFERSTIEETAHCVLGLVSAEQHGLLADRTALERAGRFLAATADQRPVERFWIGKTLFRPDNIVEATRHAAMRALTRLGVMPVYTHQPSPAD